MSYLKVSISCKPYKYMKHFTNPIVSFVLEGF